MGKNVGGMDSIVRIILGIVLMFWGLYNGATLTLPLLATVAGAIAIATALFGFCPLYRLLGVNTCRKG